jgi:hypothetical protein
MNVPVLLAIAATFILDVVRELHLLTAENKQLLTTTGAVLHCLWISMSALAAAACIFLAVS